MVTFHSTLNCLAEHSSHAVRAVTTRALAWFGSMAMLSVAVMLLVTMTPLKANTVNAESAPPAWSSFLPTPKPVGEGQLRRWGFLIYDATLWSSTGQYKPDQPFALSLTYARAVTRDQIVQASMDQIRDLGIDIDQQPQWREKLSQVFVDVKKGDTLTGIFQPDKPAVFFYNNQLTGQVDEALAQAFFAIWLDPQTSAPDLRLALLGR